MTRRAWILLALLAACTSVPEPPTQARLQSLLEHPAEFSGRTVEVEGYLAGRWLFASERAESLGDITQAVALFVRSRNDTEPFHGCVVRITGGFNADTGPGSNGSITLEHLEVLRRFQPELVLEQAPTLSREELEALLDASHGPVDAALGMVLEYPSLYQGQEIAVEGHLVLTDGAGGLFAAPAHARAFEPSTGLRVRASRDMSARRFEGGHAKVSGTLEAGPEHSEPWIGTLVATRIEPTEPPN